MPILPYPQPLRQALRRQHERAHAIRKQIDTDLGDRSDLEAAMLRGIADGAENAYDKLAGPKDPTPIVCYDTLACLAYDQAEALNLLQAHHPTVIRAFKIGQLDGYADSCQDIHRVYRQHEKQPTKECTP